jgi:hypothetical protein
MIEHSSSSSPRAIGRAIALLSLVTLIGGIVGQGFISDRLITFADPAKTASNILANAPLYRAGFTIYMVELAAQIASTVLLFHLLKPVNRPAATIAVAFGLIGCTVKIVARVFYLAPLFMLKSGAFPALAAGQAETLSLILLRVNDRGAGVAMALFGFEALLEGWLILRSGFLPRWLGVLIMIGAVGWLSFLSPTLGYDLFGYVAPVALVGMVAMIGWLLVKGVDEDRWREMAAR